jgi:CheY-like chemotaxis protein
VPLGKAPRAATPCPGAKAPLGLTLQGRLIVVVEDEAAVREGLVVLLQAWGASVVAFDTVAAVQAWLAGAPARSADLLLVDYRLPREAAPASTRWWRCARAGRRQDCRPS